MNKSRTRPPMRVRGAASLSRLRLVVGVQAVLECLRCRPKAVRACAVSRARLPQGMGELLARLPLQVQRISAGQLEAWSGVGSHQGVALWVDGGPKAFVPSKEPGSVLFLDHVCDPQNLGAILRSAWLFGVKGVYVPKNAAAGMGATVAKVASGGAEHVPVCAGVLDQEMKKLKQHGFYCVALEAGAKKNIWDLDLSQHPRVLWVLGSESRGINRGLKSLCDQRCGIPLKARHASLNVSVAAGIAMSQLER